MREGGRVNKTDWTREMGEREVSAEKESGETERRREGKEG